jgi:hypothetical protein
MISPHLAPVLLNSPAVGEVEARVRTARHLGSRQVAIYNHVGVPGLKHRLRSWL